MINVDPRDRTDEFCKILQTVEFKSKPLPPPKISKKTEFYIIANEVGIGINQTADKLQRLAELAKRKSLFDDQSEEIQDLTASINENIKKLNDQLSILQQSNNERRNKQTSSHNETIIDTLKFQLKNTTKKFSNILEMRTQSLKAQQEDQMIFMGSRSSSLSRRQNNSPLYRPLPQEEPQTSENTEVVIQMPQQTLLHDRHIQSRADAVLSIERTIVELQGIFQQLAHLVAEQGEIIQRIDNNMEDTVANVEGAQAQLMKYLSGLKNNRMLIVKLFLVLIVFIIIFIVFFL